MSRKLQDDLLIPDGVKGDVDKFEQGQRLMTVVDLPGYQDILSILRNDIEAARKKLTKYRDSDSQQVLRLLSEMQGKENALSTLESTVKSRTELANDPPTELQKYILF